MRVGARRVWFARAVVSLSVVVLLGTIVVIDIPGVAAADLGSGGVSVTGGGFSDVGGGVHEPAIDALDDLGVLEGTECGDGLFCPREPVMRWVIAVWLVRVLGEEPAEAGSSRFSDVDVGVWWAPYVEALADLGLLGGVIPSRCVSVLMSR